MISLLFVDTLRFAQNAISDLGKKFVEDAASDLGKVKEMLFG